MNQSILPIEFVDLKAQRAALSGKIENALQGVLQHGQFILGPEVKKLEQQLAAFCGAKHAIACSNGTDAIALALRAMDIQAGQAVFVPSFTFAATAEVVCWFGATPIFVDVLPDTFNIDVASLASAMDTAVKNDLKPAGVISVDLFGLPADYDAIESFCAQNGLWLICDSAQGFAATYKGRRTGSIGQVTTTSFFPAKPLGCYGDGGAVFTNDSQIADLITSLRFHGKGEDKYDNVRIGMNARLDTMQAAILLEKLAVYQDEINARNRIAARYTAALKGTVTTPHIPEGLTSVWAQYTLILEQGTDRNALITALKEKGVPAMVYYPKGLHQQTAYKHFPVAGNGLPVSENLSGRVISLPMHPYLTDAQVDYIADAMKTALSNPAQAAA